MEERLRALHLGQSLRRGWEQAAPVLLQLAAAAAGALAGGTTLLGTLAPLGVAMVAGVPQRLLLSTAAGAVMGSALSLSFPTSGQYLAAILATAGVRIALAKSSHRIEPAAAASLAGGVVLLAASLFIAVRLGDGPLRIFCAIAEGMLAIGLAMMLSIALDPLLAGRSLWEMPASVQGAAAVLLIAASASTSRLPFGGADLGTVLLGILILALGRSEPGAAAVAGISGAVGIYLHRPQAGWMGLGLAAAGIAAAAFRDQGRPAMAGCFFAASCVGVFGAQDPMQALWYLAGAGCSAVAFLLLPRRAFAALARRREENTLGDVALSGQLGGRLYALSEALCQVGSTVDQVCSRLPGPQITLNGLYDKVAEGPCADCAGRMRCWVAHCGDTLDGLTAVRDRLSKGERVGAEDLPHTLAENCLRPAVLAGAINRYYDDYLARRAASARTGALRSALTGQYAALSEALCQLAGELFEETAQDTRRARRVEELFSSIGLSPLEVRAALTRDGRCRVSVRLPRVNLSDAELRELCTEVSACCKRKLACGRQSAKGTASWLEFWEAAPLEPEFGFAGQSASGDVSADAVQSFCDARGRAHLLLCDGMGTGKAAAVDGALAANLSRQLIDAGFEGESAAKLVNVALSLKGEDSGAALDLLSADLYTGRCDIFKAGAAPTYLVRDGKASALGGEGLPVGILAGVVGRTVRASLSGGGVAVLVSDGAVAAGDEWLQAEMERLADAPAQTIADTLLESAVRRRTGRADDITIAVLRLTHRG